MRSLLLLLASAAGVGANYVIFSQRFSADPAPIVHDGRVYLYSKHFARALQTYTFLLLRPP